MTEPSVRQIELGSCQVCDKEPAVGVAAMPGVPISFAYGRACLGANAHPLWVVVANSAMVGGMDSAAEWWQELVTDTLTHLGVSRADFDIMVAQALADEAEYFAQEEEAAADTAEAEEAEPVASEAGENE